MIEISSLLNGLSFVVLALALLLSLIRLFRGPSSVDRVLVLDLLAILTAGLFSVHAVRSDQVAFLDVVLILSIIGFLSTVVFGRYFESGKEKN
jgi:multicomponent Na+:H+ antiporter subunit F